MRYFVNKQIALFALLVIAVINTVAQTTKPTVDKVIAVVADEIVLQSELEEAIIQFARSGQTIEKNSKCVIFEDLLYKKLLLNQAAVDSVEISEEQISADISRRIQYFVQQIGSVEKLEEFYGKSLAEIKDEFHDLIEEQMLIQQMQGSVTADVDVSPKEIKAFFNKIPKDSLPLINSEVVVEHIVIDPIMNENEKTLTKNRLNEIRDRIINGENFGTLAYLYSEDPGSARKNGELGFMERKDLVKEFAEVAFSIEPGQVSEVFETQFGFHILQLIERRGQQANVRHILLKPKFSQADLFVAKGRLDSLRKQIIEVDSVTFELMAPKHSDDKSTRNNAGKIINSSNGTTTFEIDELSKVDPSLFFILDKMKPGDISQPVIYQKYDGSQSYRLVKLVSVTEPHRANMESDYLKIKAAALAEKEKEAVDRWITNKIKVNYIRINEEYRTCTYQHNWF